MHVYPTLRRAGLRARWLTGFLAGLMALPMLAAGPALAATGASAPTPGGSARETASM